MISSHPLLKNYYALFLSIVQGYSVDQSMSAMGLKSKEYRHRPSKLCEMCGNEHTGQGRTCSVACKTELSKISKNKVKEKRYCEICGKEVKGFGETCSRKCGAMLRNKRAGKPLRKKVEVKQCVICGKEHTGQGKSCSVHCSKILIKQTKAKRRNRAI